MLPPNSICRASVPQVDILRCMDSFDLFVHHGGQNSTMEGGFAGIPVIVCPTFSDQPVNAAKLVGERFLLFMNSALPEVVSLISFVLCL